MTADELQQLVAFIGPKFDAVDERFDRIETRLTRVEVLQERQGDELRLVAEGLTSFREEVGRRFDEVDGRFKEQDSRMRGLFREQGQRTDALDARVTGLERRR